MGTLQYARACLDHGKPEGAVQALLRLIVASSKHKSVRKMLAEALGPDTGIALLRESLPFTVESAPALAFIAVILKV